MKEENSARRDLQSCTLKTKITFILYDDTFPNVKQLLYRQVKIRNKWPDRKKNANKRFIADLC